MPIMLAFGFMALIRGRNPNKAIILKAQKNALKNMAALAHNNFTLR
jgi:hypothetical protein